LQETDERWIVNGVQAFDGQIARGDDRRICGLHRSQDVVDAVGGFKAWYELAAVQFDAASVARV